MLIKTSKGEIINLDNVTGIFNKGNELVCYIPSVEMDRPYQEFYLGVSAPSSIRYVTNQICNMYRQTLVSATGNMLVAPQVYEIPASYSTSYISAANVTIDRSNEAKSQKLMEGNRLYVDIGLMYNGISLRENIDYTVIYPLYKGKGIIHTVIFTFIKSKSLYYVGFYSKYPQSSILQRLATS